MGCKVCRARKVKCDGRPGGCHNCERLELECVNDDGSAAVRSATSAAGASASRGSTVSLRKIRTYRSCSACRSSKTKCSGDRPRCSRCISKKVDCVYDGGSAPRWAKNLDARPSTGTSAHGLSSPTGETGGSLDPTGSLFDVGAVQNSIGIMDESVRQASDSMDVTDDGIPAALPSPALSREPARPSFRDGNDSRKPSQQRVVQITTPDTIAWLLSPELPATRHLRKLAEQYFANLHPLRCFAFVHKPSFMRQLDKGFETDDEKGLLHIICAHGAKFHVLSLQQNDQALGIDLLKAAGNQWAKAAEQIMFTSFGKISVPRLMTAILLHDYHFRLGEYSQALMLSGLCVRMAHALKINTEFSSDIMCTEPDPDAPSVATRESRRRLMWACYVLDAWTGSGVDQLTLLRENDIKIQLPCNERNFGLRIASVTETLGVGHVLQFLPPAIVPRRPAANMGIMAYYIRIVTLWKKVVRYMNHLDSGPPPWAPDSEFSALDGDLRLWRRELPDFVEYSTETIYARLDSNQLGALVLIHCTYHHNFLELYKISMPDLFKLVKPYSFPPEHFEFLQAIQADCYYHAHQISCILAEAAEHGSRLLSDSLLPFFIFDSSRVMLYYVTKLLDPARPDAQSKLKEAVGAVESNNKILQSIAPLYSVSESLSSTIQRWLAKINATLGHSTSRESLADIDISTPSVASPTTEYTLPPLSLHRLTQRHGSHSNGSAAQRSSAPEGWHTENPNAHATWDHTTAAQQLVGLSQESPSARSGLQHEKPVSNHPQPLPNSSAQDRAPTQQANGSRGSGIGPAMTPGGSTDRVGERLDLDDLQNFLSWDMYGIMEMGDVMGGGLTLGADEVSSMAGTF